MNSAIQYARLPQRVQAAMIDSFIIFFIIVILMVQLARLELESPTIKIALFLTPVLLYEPLLISRFGGTIGYRIMRQQVVRADTHTFLPFGLAVLRTIVKILLGWLSLIFIWLSKRNQALHDHLVNSVVILEQPSIVSSKNSGKKRAKS